MWTDFFNEIKDKMNNPLKFPQMVGYFIFSIIIIGALGVNIKIWNCYFNGGEVNEIPKEMATYLIAILGTSFLDLNLSHNLRNKDSFLVYSLIVLMIGVFFVFLIVNLKGTFSFVFAILGVFIAWIMWWFTNSDNILLTRIPPVLTQDDTTGGDANAILNGSLTDFKNE